MIAIFPLSQSSPTRHRRGFTMTEILVVLAIIIILMGLLFPVIHKVRYAAYAADTSQEISQLSNSINQYYATFRAYPGPFSNDVVDQSQSGTLVSMNEITTPGSAGSSTQFHLTGTENLVLGLLGGLDYNPAVTTPTPTAPACTVNIPEIGMGPMSMNPNNPQRLTAFLSTKVGSTNILYTSSSTTAGSMGFKDLAGNGCNDSDIPCFIDKFPDPGPMPILYARARLGAPGIICDGTLIDPITTAVAVYQYDFREISGYLMTPGSTSLSSVNNLGIPPGNSHDLNEHSGGAITFIGKGIASAGSQFATNSTHDYTDLGPYFANSSITPTNTGGDAQYNSTGRPHAVDQFILISAGADGIYGTADDIVSFGSVTQ